MKKLVYSGTNESVAAYCHLLVTEKGENACDYNKIIAVGLIDVDSSARATAAKVSIGNKTFTITHDAKGWNGKVIFAEGNSSFRFWQNSIGKRGNKKFDESYTTHCMVFHKRITDTKEERERQNVKGGRVILAVDGDVVKTFGRLLVEEYNLPNLESWFKPLAQHFTANGWLKELDVWSNPDVKVWANLQAFTLSNDLTEQAVLEAVSEGIRAGWLEVPEGSTDAPAVTSDMDDVTKYLMEFAPHLAAQIEDVVEPLHDLDKPLERGIALMKRVPFPAQGHTIQALVNGLDKKKAVFTIADMGCGKSIQALGVANVLWQRAKTSGRKGFVSFILAPGVTIPKWAKDEIQATLPNAKITILEDWHDTVAWIDRVRENKFKKENGLEFVLMGKDSAKLGLKRLPSLNWKRIIEVEDGKSIPTTRYSWHCPHCFNSIQTLDGEDKFDQQKIWARYAEGDEPGHAVFANRIKWKEAKKPIHCPSCGESLTRFADPKAGEMGRMKNRRMEPAWLIQRYLKGYIDLLIVDELQQYKNDSGQGVSMASLVSASKHVCGLTGTLSDGKSSSLFQILSRADFNRLKDDGFTHNSSTRFVHRYGVVETVVRYEEEAENAGGMTRGKVKGKTEKELPGLSPKLFVNHLADKTAFLELGDLGLPLVKLEETPVFIKMDDEHEQAYRSFHYDLEIKCKTSYVLGNKGAFAKFIPSVVNYANQPFRDFEIELGEDNSVYGPQLYDEGEYTAKERRLVQDVQDEIAQGRRCIVYVNYSGGYKQDNRLAQVLQDHGVNAKVMKSSVDADERIEWMKQAVEDGVDCVCLNVSLVECGVDLLDFPTLIFYQQTDKISTLRQASRRAWRIGQTRNCKILHYIYENSYEVIQFQRNMAKRSHAMLLEGRLERSAMSQYMVADKFSATTVSLAECLVGVNDLAQKWTELADKDIPKGVLMLDESVFKDELKKAMTRLANETRRLCGVPVVVVDNTKQDVKTAPEVEKVSAFVPNAETPVASGELDLFAFDFDANAVEQVAPVELVASAVSDEPVYEPDVQIVTNAELRASFGFVAKAKKASKKKAANDDQQLAFLF